MSNEPTTGGEEGRHPGGRPTILTPELLQEIIGYVAAGNYLATSCRAAGIDEDNGWNWIKWGREGRDAEGEWPDAYREFFGAYQKADAKAEIQCATEVLIAGRPHAPRTVEVTDEDGRKVRVPAEPGQWQATMTFMERRWHERFGRKDKLGLGQDPTAGPLQTQQVPVTEVLTNERAATAACDLEAALASAVEADPGGAGADAE